MTGRAPQWWDWCRALDQLAESDGQVGTGLAWALRCWSWGRDDSEERVLERTRQPRLEEFQAQHRPDIALRTLRRHFTDLQRLGLLRLVRPHSPASPNIYAPRLPDGWGKAADSGHQRPVLAADSGHQRPQQGPLVATTPFSPEILQNNPPTRDAHDARATHTRGSQDRGGGVEAKPTNDRAARAAIEECIGAMPPAIGSRMTDGWRDSCVAATCKLIAAEWLPGQIARAVNQASWTRPRVVKVGAVLKSRLEDLLEQPAPSADHGSLNGRATWPAWCGECDERTRQRFTEPPDRGECLGHCPTCHPLEVPRAGGAGGVS